MVWPTLPAQGEIQTLYRHPPPADKQIEISLIYLHISNSYLVKQVINTTWYHPGEWLNEDIAAKICALPKWKVTIEHFEWFQQAMQIGLKVIP